MNRALISFLIASAVLVLLGATFLTGQPRSAVDWHRMQAVAIESDDWGLAGFVPDAGSWQGLDKEALDPGPFPDVYWLSTLEDSAMVAQLCAVLERHRDRLGHPALFQPNYILSSQSFDSRDNPVRHDLPDFPPAYLRPGLWDAVTDGIGAGVWYPEYHGTWHYDPDQRQERGFATDLAREVTSRGITLFPGSEKARELGGSRPVGELAGELDHSIEVFENLFGRPFESVIAPDYVWSSREESLWETRGLRVLQAKREQRNPGWGAGKLGRIRKLLGRKLDQWAHPGRTYLERNCRLEPVQAPDPDLVVRNAIQEVREAWAKGQPAIVESHRINFVHTDPQLVRIGVDAMDVFLGAVSKDGPVYVSDIEIARLARTGTSWVRVGETIRVRNGSRGRKVVPIPAAALVETRALESPVLVTLDPGETGVLRRRGAVWVLTRP